MGKTMYYDNVLISDLMSDDYLAHYGVIGMHWGVRKAERYARDTNQARRNDEVRKSRLDKNRGKITKQQHKENVKKANAKQKAKNKKVHEDLKKVPRAQKGVKARTISDPYKNKAYSEIRNYGGKKMARGVNKGFLAYNGLSFAASIPVSMIAGVPASFAIPAAVAGMAIGALPAYAVVKTVSKKTM